MKANADPLMVPDRTTTPPRAEGHELRPGESLFLPNGRAAQPSGFIDVRTLPPHLQEQLPRRLRNVALLYSLGYFLSDLAPAIVTGTLAQTFTTLAAWATTVGSILIGLAVAAIASSPRLSWRAKMHVGLAFEAVGSYGIAMSMYVGAERFANTPEVFFALAPSWLIGRSIRSCTSRKTESSRSRLWSARTRS